MKHFIQNALAAKKKLYLFGLVMLMSITGVQKANAAKEIYAARTGTMMTIYYDDQKASRFGVLDKWTPEEGVDMDDATRSFITMAVISPSMVDARPTRTYGWFFNLKNLTTIEGLANLNTSEVTDMSYMFAYCSSLTSLDVSNFNTANVTKMNYMFYGCSLLTSLNVSSFDVFHVQNMKGMFQGCTSLKTIYCDNEWNPSKSDDMFEGCTALVGGKGTKYNAGKTDDTYARPDGKEPGYFTRITPYTTTYVEFKDGVLTYYYDNQILSRTGVVAEYYNGYYDNSLRSVLESITKAVISPSMASAPLQYMSRLFSFRNTTNMQGYFSNLTTIEGLENLNMSRVTDMDYMFYRCTSLTSLNVSSFDVSHVRNMKGMFQGCTSLKTIYCDDEWNPSSSDDMFEGCTALVGGKGTKYDAGHVNAAYARPDGLDDQPGYFTSTTYTGEAWIDGINYFLDGSDLTAQVLDLSGDKYVGDIVLPEKVKFDKYDFTVTSINSEAFTNSPELLSVSLPKTVNWIEPGSFLRNPKLTAINVAPANTTYSSLDGVLFNTVQTELIAYPTGRAGAYVVPEGVESILDEAFTDNANLTAITLPASLIEIASLAFDECTGLTAITSKAVNAPAAGSDAFQKVSKSIPVYVPQKGLASYKAEYEWKDFTNFIAIEDKAAADAVIVKIDAIGTVTYTTECKARIDAAREAYDALTDAQKALVTNLATLTAAEKAYADLKAKAEADQAAATAVIGKIDAIGEVTLASEPAIVAARSAYNALTADQKALVSNYSVLTAAEAKLEVLKQQAEADQAAATAVIGKINAIGTVAYDEASKARIDDARHAYDALTAAQKALVTNYGVLTAAEQAYADLKAQAEVIAAAKQQLVDLVSEATALKAVAAMYAPAAVGEIEAIIASAQATINDPNATLEEINMKYDNLQYDFELEANKLLEEAKEQLKQSIRALYQPGDYPSWYASAIIPALDQVDAITWDFNKSVQDNILLFQATGQTLYNNAKKALEDLRASDTRELVSSCAFTGFENGIKADMTWNIKALNNLINTLNASVAAEPYRLDAEMSSLGKWDPVNKELIILDPYEAQKLTAGDYQFITAVKIDGEDAKQYRLPKATEEVLSVTVDAAVWAVDLSGIVIDANYSYTYVTSPMFTISKSEDVELIEIEPVKTQKIYHNGHFYILRGEHIYDLRGTLVR